MPCGRVGDRGRPVARVVGVGDLALGRAPGDAEPGLGQAAERVERVVARLAPGGGQAGPVPFGVVGRRRDAVERVRLRDRPVGRVVGVGGDAAARVGQLDRVPVGFVLVGGHPAQRVGDRPDAVVGVVGRAGDGPGPVDLGDRAARAVGHPAGDAAERVRHRDRVAEQVAVARRVREGIGHLRDPALLVGVHSGHPRQRVGGGPRRAVRAVAERGDPPERVGGLAQLAERPGVGVGPGAGGRGPGQLGGPGDVAEGVVGQVRAPPERVGRAGHQVGGRVPRDGRRPGERVAERGGVGRAVTRRVEGDPADGAARIGQLGLRHLAERSRSGRRTGRCRHAATVCLLTRPLVS